MSTNFSTDKRQITRINWSRMDQRIHMGPGILIFLCALITWSGCSMMTQTPVPTTYPYTTQQKMQAAHHWNILATDVASQTQEILMKSGLQQTPLYVEKLDSPFGDGFRDFLITRLYDNGLTIVTENDPDALLVEYKVQLVHHKANRQTRLTPGLITGTGAVLSGSILVLREIIENGSTAVQLAGGTGMLLGAAGLADIMAGRYIHQLPHREVIITTGIIDSNRYVLRKTDIYYINDDDSDHYVKPSPPPRLAVRDHF